jgi:multidrug efflux pump subunit AcrB
MPALSELALPPGYGIEFDPDAIRSAEALSGSWKLFVLALCLCYIVLAASRESFLFPFKVLAVVPPSLAFPALCMASLDAASASAFVAVSGMAVNAAVLVAETNSASAAGLYRVLRKRLPLLAATSGTTIAGALPFLFLARPAASVVRSLSLVSAFGVAASVLCSVSLIPALTGRVRRKRTGYSNSQFKTTMN